MQLFISQPRIPKFLVGWDDDRLEDLEDDLIEYD